MKSRLNRFAPVLTVLALLGAFAIAGALEASESRGLTSDQSLAPASLPAMTTVTSKRGIAPRHTEVTTREWRTRSLTELCGKHKDVAPAVSEAMFLAVISTLARYPQLRRDACRSWLSYREV